MRTFLSLLATAILSFAQAPQQQLPPVQSPDVQNDGRVTFRFRDPNAQHVSVSLAGAKAPYAMQKDSQGVWSVTTEPLTPDLYGYSFNADGVRLLDPSNHVVIPNLLNPSSEVHVASSSAQPWDMTDIRTASSTTTFIAQPWSETIETSLSTRHPDMTRAVPHCIPYCTYSRL